MSTLNVSDINATNLTSTSITSTNITDGTTTYASLASGSAKAWVNFDGTTVTINGSVNVSSITDNGAGYFTVNTSNALTDIYYAGAGAGVRPNNESNIIMREFSTGRTSSSYPTSWRNSGNTAYDPEIAGVTIHGDLA